MSEELQASGGAGAPAEVLDYDKVEKPVSAGLTLVDEERELAEAILEVVERYGKFNADNTGVWAGYTPAAENEDNAAIGVKCGNCIFWEAPNGCKIIQAETEEGGLCRFAILPDGAVTATAGSKPAPKKDRIFGSKKNKKGSAASGKGVSFSKKVEDSLAEKVKKHNEKAKEGRKTSLRTLKAVYRRGAGAFSTSHRPDQNRNSWAMARVNAFLKLLRSGRPSNPKYTTDNDLLPASHPRSSKSSAEALLAALTYQEELTPMLWESHVPTEEMGRLLEKYNSKVGSARQVDFTALSDVAERAIVAYGYLEQEEIYNAVHWDVTGFMEFATQGKNESSEFYDRYQDLLPTGHPLVASAAADEVAWIAAGYTDDQDLIDTLVASVVPTDNLSCLYAATRIKAIAEAGNISAEALEAVNAVAQKYTASH